MVWALSDPALKGYVGSGGTVGQPWPALQQVLRVERQRTLQGRGCAPVVEREVTYAITSVPAAEADAARLAGWLRGHWGIENRTHWIRDVDFDEDRSQVRSGAAPQVLAAGRNLAIALLRRAGYRCIAAALRTLARRSHCAVQLVLSAGL
jgi:hypothetical protein